VAKLLTDDELLEQLLGPDYIDRLSPTAREAFTGWRDGERHLSEKMQKWLRGEAERVGLQTAPSENIFSALSPARQAEQRARAAKVKLPWEK
jgi:hypothetical protein